MQYGDKRFKSLAAKEWAKEGGLSIWEAECHLDAELFLNEYPGWDVGGLHCLFICQQMFVHAAESRQKEVERLIHHSHWQGLPRLDSEADVPAVQLVGYWMSREEIGDLYHQVYILKRLPGTPPCGSEWAWDVTRDILFSLKDCLRQKRGSSQEEVENWSLPTFVHPAIVTKPPREKGRTLHVSKNLSRPGRPISGPWWLLPYWRSR